MFTQDLDDLQLRIHVKYDTTDTDVPDSDSDDWLLRTQLANDAIEVWEQEGTDMGGWAELFITLAQQYTLSAAAPNTIATSAMRTWVAGQTDYDVPTNFVRPVGFVFITNTDGTQSRHEHMRPEKVQRAIAEGSDAKYYYITGNRKVGYKLHIMGQDYESGAIIDYAYYKTCSALTTGSDIVEMSNPRFVFLRVLADLFADDDADRSAQCANEAIGVLETMRLQNIMALEEQRDRIQESVASDFGFGG